MGRYFSDELCAKSKIRFPQVFVHGKSKLGVESYVNLFELTFYFHSSINLIGVALYFNNKRIISC